MFKKRGLQFIIGTGDLMKKLPILAAALLFLSALIISVSAQNVSQLFNQGVASFRVNNYEPAISKLKQVIKLNPKHSEAHFYLASCYYNTKKYSDAVDYFKEAIRLKPSYFDAYILLGKMLKKHKMNA